MKKVELFIKLCNKNQNNLLIFVAVLSISSSMLYTIFDSFNFNDLGLLTLAVTRLITGLAALVYVLRAFFNIVILNPSNLKK
ncbi:hypothetical protein LPB90_18315 [Chryseobacterium sp. LC2016-29]|uniref:hypothetical protein n=1 Tax=Chryseobacterium sp. LC2016-29 TaxID=2897331 RepID=UPI001E630D06|nr:hypothetical protein [Chryseobacterium sp. LC2016-29]MCD0480397.1 hypothetical protein [Chryseobacterium sp. LC2016-29]